MKLNNLSTEAMPPSVLRTVQQAMQPLDSLGAEDASLSTERIADRITEWFPLDSIMRDLTFLDIANWKWLGLLVLLTLAVTLERISSWVLRRIVRNLASLDQVKLDEPQLNRFVRPFGLMVTTWLFLHFYPILGVADKHTLSSVVGMVGEFLVSLAGMIAAWRFMDVVCDFLRSKALQTDNKFDDMLVPLMRRTLKIFVIVIGVAYFSSKVTEDFYKVIAGLSIGSALLAFAFKDSLENIFGTFTVLMDKPFQLGDWITVEDVDGTVERVGFRSTRVRTFYNSLISVPNRLFISARVDNWGSRQYRRVKTTLGLTYDTPPEKIEAFCEGVREIIRTHPYTRKDYYHVYLNGFGDSSLDILLYCFVQTPDWSMELREKHRLFADILRLAERLGVEFAFPSTSIYVTKPEDLHHPNRPETDGDGARIGRDLGREIAEETLRPFGGNRPGKVKFLQQSSPLASPGGEGDGG